MSGGGLWRTALINFGAVNEMKDQKREYHINLNLSGLSANIIRKSHDKTVRQKQTHKLNSAGCRDRRLIQGQDCLCPAAWSQHICGGVRARTQTASY